MGCVGIGEPIFASLESDLSKALFSIPAVKAVEFGSGFAGSKMLGSENNDSYLIKDGKVVTKTNNAGGIGGLSNGMPIVIRVGFKPAFTLSRTQLTLDISTNEQTQLTVPGRHDPCVVRVLSLSSAWFLWFWPIMQSDQASYQWS